MKTNINFRTRRALLPTKDFIYRYKRRGKEKSEKFMYRNLINKTIFLKKKSQENAMKFVFSHRFVVVVFQLSSFAFFLFLFLLLSSSRTTTPKVKSNVAMKKHKTNKDSVEGKYLILIEFLFFNFIFSRLLFMR